MGHEPYGMRDSSAWDSLIARPFRLRKPIAFHRLITTLEGLISMRDKDYVKNIMGLELQNQVSDVRDVRVEFMSYDPCRA